jgi:hypothetical protein
VITFVVVDVLGELVDVKVTVVIGDVVVVGTFLNSIRKQNLIQFTNQNQTIILR